ncbi:MAG TPA: hypothetical protein VNP92_08400, partial [Actinophytocola sp.]|nr:hypothetical protein [Actinophytocola sp.]
KYFLVLVALCEPRLRDPWSSVIPSAPEIVDRLRPLDSCRDLTRSAVNFHIDYLARTKVPVAHEGAPRADWRRAALVSAALRFGLVRPEHQMLLPSRARATGSPVAST